MKKMAVLELENEFMKQQMEKLEIENKVMRERLKEIEKETKSVSLDDDYSVYGVIGAIESIVMSVQGMIDFGIMMM